MSTLDAFIVAQEQCQDGLCPARAWCFGKRLRVSKHAWYWHRCAFEQHYQLWQCCESDDGHEHIPGRGIAEARCDQADICGEANCPHAAPHRWDPMHGCHAVRCRKLVAIVEKWDEEMRGEPPETVVVCEVI